MSSSNEILLAAFSKIALGVIIIDANKVILHANPWLTEHLNAPLELEGNVITELFKDLPIRLLRAVDKACTRGRSSILSNKLTPHPLPLVHRSISSEGDKPIEQIVKVKPFTFNGENVCLIEVWDVSDSVAREVALNQLAEEASEKTNQIATQEKRIRSVFESVKDAVIIIDELGKITLFNQTTVELLKRSKKKLMKSNVFDFIKMRDLTKYVDETRHDSTSGLLNALASGKETIEITIDHPNADTHFIAELSISSFEHDGQHQFVVVLRDITERILHQKMLEKMANYDELTGLPNRTLLKERLKMALLNAKRNDTQIAVIFFDLDRFKIINDTLGHVIGDYLLKEVAARLKSNLRDSDTIARLGGDEFVIVSENIKDQNGTVVFVEKLIAILRDVFTVSDHQLYITCSMGIATFPENGQSAVDLLKCADTAMYSAKDTSKSNYLFFSNEMNEKAKSRLELESDFRKAVKKRQLSIVLQPQICSNDESIYGAEVLIRWHHPEKGFIPPDIFVPLAEDIGLIESVSDFVVEQACEFLTAYKNELPENFKIGINVSPRQFNTRKFSQSLISTIRKYQLPTSYFELELTEGILMQSSKEVICTLSVLVNKGFIISIDDFGTGYSSLSYLKKFPLHTIKIDRSFISDLPHDKDSIAVCKTIIGLAKNLGLQLIAEGVETKEQYQYLANENCDMIQGYFFSKPLSKEEFYHWMKDYQSGK